jgi:hypothetical protein
VSVICSSRLSKKGTYTHRACKSGAKKYIQGSLTKSVHAGPKGQVFREQSKPVHPLIHWHCRVCLRQSPFPLQSLGHGVAVRIFCAYVVCAGPDNNNNTTATNEPSPSKAGPAPTARGARRRDNIVFFFAVTLTQARNGPR